MTHAKRILAQLKEGENDESIDGELREQLAERRREIEEELET